MEGILEAALVVVTALLEPVIQLGVGTICQHQTEDSATTTKQPFVVVSQSLWKLSKVSRPVRYRGEWTHEGPLCLALQTDAGGGEKTHHKRNSEGSRKQERVRHHADAGLG